MLRAQIFTLQSAEPLKINLSLSDKDRDLAAETDRETSEKLKNYSKIYNIVYNFKHLQIQTSLL